MGLLDDAIREHLELKRSRGADAQEISRQEREAFGPVRGAEASTPEAPPPPPPPETAEHTGAVPMTSPAHEPPEPDPIPEPPVVEADLPEPPPERAAVRSEPPIVEDDEIGWSDPPRVEDDETPPAEEEDVLEETPEFLQETPEHDRLWFEQRPPKDFDF